jgi:hypothetical protein
MMTGELFAEEAAQAEQRERDRVAEAEAVDVDLRERDADYTAMPIARACLRASRWSDPAMGTRSKRRSEKDRAGDRPFDPKPGVGSRLPRAPIDGACAPSGRPWYHSRAMPVANLTNIALSADVALKADIASPTFTGTVTIPTLAVGTAGTAPTLALGDSTTGLATTAFATNTDGLTVTVASDAAAAILESTRFLNLEGSAAGTKVITQTSTRPHQHLRIRLAAASGGEYNLPQAAGVPGGALTFNAADEYADLYRNSADTAWYVVLTGATIV